MPPKGRKKVTVAKRDSTEIDAEFPSIEKILKDKSQATKSGRGHTKANVADDETIVVGQIELNPEMEKGDVDNGISNGTKMNGGEKEIDAFDRLLLDSATKKDDWRLEFSPDASRMPENGADLAKKESEDLTSDEEDVKSNGKALSDDGEVDTAEAKEEIKQVTEEEIEEAKTKDETEEPNVEVEKVPEKQGHKKAAEKVPEKEIEEAAMKEEPEKVVGRRGRKKAEVDTEAKEEPKKVSAKRGRKKAEVIEEEVVEVAADEIDEEREKPMAKRGRKKAEVVSEEIADDETEEEKPVAKRGHKKHEEVEEELPKSKRGRKKAGVVVEDIADEESEEESKKPAAKRGRKKAGRKIDEIADDKLEEEEEQEKPKARRGRPKAVIRIEDSEEKEKPRSMRGREIDEIAVDKSEEEEEQEKPKARRGRPKAVIPIEDSEEQEKPRSMRGRNKVELVASKEPEKPVARRGRKKAKIPEVAEKTEKVAGKRGRAEVIELETFEESSKVPGKRGRKRKANVPEASDANKKGKEAFDEDDISDFAGRELRVAMTRNCEIDEMARKTLPPHPSHKEAGNVQKPSDKTYVMAKPVKEQPTKSGRKRANQDDKESKPEKVKKDEPAKEGKSGAKKAQIPDVSALDFGSNAKTSDDQPWNFKIASWNVNGVRAWLEKGGMSYLKHEDPDILCIQETKCSEDKLPEELQVEGYHCHWLAGDKDGYSGVGLMSKTEPISITEGIGIKEHDNEGRVITAEYEKFYLVTAYVPNSGRGLVRLDYRKTWDKDFRAYLIELDEKKPVVLCGDLNVAHEEIDIANPKSNKKNAGFTQEERDGFSALLEEGFVDTFRHLHSDEKGAYTFWTYMMNARAKNVGWRLDYFVISERFKDHLCDSLIRKDVMGSDHCPVGLLLHI